MRYAALQWEPFRFTSEQPESGVLEMVQSDYLKNEVNRNNPYYFRWVQDALNKTLGIRLTVDGIMDPLTRSAIRSFQQRENLVVDGIVDANTEMALRYALGQISASIRPVETEVSRLAKPPVFRPRKGVLPYKKANTMKDRLNTNQRMFVGDRITSPNGRAYLILQNDGNFVLYTSHNVPLWATGTNGKPIHSVVMQHDGNLVLLTRENRPVWATASHGHIGSSPYLVIQNDGNAVIYTKDRRPIWASDTQGFRVYKPKGGWFENAVKSAGRAIGSGVHLVSSATGAIDKAISSIPFAGPVLHGAFVASQYLGPSGLITGAANIIKNTDTLFKIADDIASGKRLDRVAMGALNRQVQDIKDTAQFAQMVISFVPGVGPAVSGALAAGVALANGQRIDQIMVEAIKGAVPGGPIAKTAFSIAEGAIQGKRIDDIALSALPIPPEAKKVISTGIHLAERLAKGERLDKVALDEAKKLLPPNVKKAVEVAESLGDGKKMADLLIEHGGSALGRDAKKALMVGMATGYAEKLQRAAITKVGHPQFLNRLKQLGETITKTDNVLNAGQRLLGKQGSAGYKVAAAVMKHRIAPYELKTIRDKLSPADKKGFDLATSLHIGRVTNPKPKTFTPSKSQVGFYATKGMMGARRVQKQALIKAVVADPAAKASAVLAIRQAAKARKSLGQRRLDLNRNQRREPHRYHGSIGI